MAPLTPSPHRLVTWPAISDRNGETTSTVCMRLGPPWIQTRNAGPHSIEISQIQWVAIKVQLSLCANGVYVAWNCSSLRSIPGLPTLEGALETAWEKSALTGSSAILACGKVVRCYTSDVFNQISGRYESVMIHLRLCVLTILAVLLASIFMNILYCRSTYAMFCSPHFIK